MSEEPLYVKVILDLEEYEKLSNAKAEVEKNEKFLKDQIKELNEKLAEERNKKRSTTESSTSEVQPIKVGTLQLDQIALKEQEQKENSQNGSEKEEKSEKVQSGFGDGFGDLQVSEDVPFRRNNLIVLEKDPRLESNVVETKTVDLGTPPAALRKKQLKKSAILPRDLPPKIKKPKKKEKKGSIVVKNWYYIGD